ncbi:regulatory signaling modulator protein AmpE [Halopseudomonas salegens]|uniref:AmpE protein n=1 Tax=Halopseudomonas salegens TaxID=1434072 RepID=A0A1H2ELM7_9GAMM|nr:regulatory signaling modulator protein AmpE [Halopseudomonas salegens]SDT96082.1 AmpE protein [Halopseudomonas salegens]
MSFLVLLLVVLILRFTPWRTGFPLDLVTGWSKALSPRCQHWHPLLALTALLSPLLLLWLLDGLLTGFVYGLFTLLLHVLVLLLCVGRSDPLGNLFDELRQALLRNDHQAASLLAERDFGLTTENPQELRSALQGHMLWETAHGYFIPLFWYLLLGPLGALGYRLLQRGQGFSWPAADWSARLCHALEWLPVRMLGLSFALVGRFEQALSVIRDYLGNWDQAASQVVTRIGRAALGQPETAGTAALDQARQLLLRALLIWVVMWALISLV